MAEAREPVKLMADVIREAVTCDRTECLPDDHIRFVSENMQIATTKNLEGAVR
ncbi:hypothetical protein ACIRJM_22100 [Streptomyces sp. NPDC102405]|uniref:hypothetical protein n=1 Tax=Streptomyces sp. NPDC102405 TaxID=3366170 RepID=UPI00381E6FFE